MWHFLRSWVYLSRKLHWAGSREGHWNCKGKDEISGEKILPQTSLLGKLDIKILVERYLWNNIALCVYAGEKERNWRVNSRLLGSDRLDSESRMPAREQGSNCSLCFPLWPSASTPAGGHSGTDPRTRRRSRRPGVESPEGLFPDCCAQPGCEGRGRCWGQGGGWPRWAPCPWSSCMAWCPPGTCWSQPWAARGREGGHRVVETGTWCVFPVFGYVGKGRGEFPGRNSVVTSFFKRFFAHSQSFLSWRHPPSLTRLNFWHKFSPFFLTFLFHEKMPLFSAMCNSYSRAIHKVAFPKFDIKAVTSIFCLRQTFYTGSKLNKEWILDFILGFPSRPQCVWSTMRVVLPLTTD